MNTNETIEYEIPTEEELDVSIQGAERRGYRAGVEASYEAARKAWPMALRECQADEILDAIYNLLPEQGEKQCKASIWHGPGHQSQTYCQKHGPHEIHETIYGSRNQFARWRGDEIYSGFCDEPPELAEQEKK